jgi:hypothetical protein
MDNSADLLLLLLLLLLAVPAAIRKYGVEGIFFRLLVCVAENFNDRFAN